jgi:hypothetical protein
MKSSPESRPCLRDCEGLGHFASERACDNCVKVANSNRQDRDHDGVRDACDFGDSPVLSKFTVTKERRRRPSVQRLPFDGGDRPFRLGEVRLLRGGHRPNGEFRDDSHDARGDPGNALQRQLFPGGLRTPERERRVFPGKRELGFSA